ncbi:MAG: DUF202 domain-containing protein [Renibacterium sp.]|nr:DUF202 domain-containing protein [Renibacterium sp.]
MSGSLAGSAAPRDPGLQIERTIMAWWRTIVSMIVVDIFAWRFLVHEPGGQLPGILQISGLLLTAAGTLGFSVCFYLRQRALRRGPEWAAAEPRILVASTGWLLTVFVGGALSVLAGV